MAIREQRTVVLDSVTVRSDIENSDIRVDGHAAVWDKPAWIGPAKYGFSERFLKGAFSKTISDKADVRYLFNHNPDHILARTKSGTLALREDTTGLDVDATLAPTSVGRDLAILMERGDVNQMSVGMQVIQDKWEEIEGRDGNIYELRTITEAKLFDVSAVTYPAYEDTDAGLRMAQAGRESRDARGAAVKRLRTSSDLVSVNEIRETERLDVIAPNNDDSQYATAMPNEEPVTATPDEVSGPRASDPPAETPEDENPEVNTASADIDAHDSDERSLPLTDILLRHMDGDHLYVPRALCPACAKAEPLSGSQSPEGTSN